MKNKFDISQFVNVLTEQSVMDGVADRIKKRRKQLKISQQELSKKSGVTYGSIRRFESTGEISFSSLLKIANALGYLADFNLLFAKETITSLKEY